MTLRRANSCVVDSSQLDKRNSPSKQEKDLENAVIYWRFNYLERPRRLADRGGLKPRSMSSSTLHFPERAQILLTSDFRSG